MMKRPLKPLVAVLMLALLLHPEGGWAQNSVTPIVPGGNSGNPSGAPTSERSPFAPGAGVGAPRAPSLLPSTSPGVTPALPTTPITLPSLEAAPMGTSSPLGQQPSPNAPAPPTAASETTLPTQLPAGTLAPVTLKATLEKSKTLALSLEQALQLAQGQNIAIQLAEETVEQSRLTYLTRLSDLLPDLTLQYVQSRFTGAVQIFGGSTMNIYRTTYQPQITANYIIYTGGSNIFAIKASKQREEAQKKLAEDTLQDTLRLVALGYYDLQQAYLQRAIALQGIAETTQQVELNQARERSGVGIRLDVLQAQTLLSAQQDALIQAENLAAQAAENLEQLLNLDFAVDLVPNSIDASVTHLIPTTMSGPTLLSIAQANHPRLKALSTLVQASKTDVKTVITSYFPQINISAYTNGTGASIDSLQPAYFAGILATSNILSNLGTAPILAVKQARTSVKISELNYADANRLLQRDLSTAVINLKALEAQIAVAQQTLQFAKSTYQNAFGRMQAGVGTNLDLQNALTNLTRARSILATAFINYNKAEVALLSNLGVVSTDTLTHGYTAPTP